MNTDDTTQRTDSPVQDAQIVSENGAQVLMDLEHMIKSNIAGIEKRKHELKTQKEMVANVLANDSTYQEHEQKVKEASKVRNATKAEIMKQPNMQQLVAKIKELTTEVKETDAALSDYLREYQRLSGSNEIEGEDGEVREIVYVAKLVKKSSRLR